MFNQKLQALISKHELTKSEIDQINGWSQMGQQLYIPKTPDTVALINQKLQDALAAGNSRAALELKYLGGTLPSTIVDQATKGLQAAATTGNAD